MNMKKRGLSGVVATVLLIMLTMAAIAILAGVVISFVRGGAEYTECLDYGGHVTLQEKFDFEDVTYRYNCFDVDEDIQGVSVRVKTLPEGEETLMREIKIVLSSDTGSDSYTIKEGETFPNVKMINGLSALDLPAPGELKTYIIDTGGERYSEITVFPVLESGKSCGDEKDSIEIIDCQDEIAFNY